MWLLRQILQPDARWERVKRIQRSHSSSCTPLGETKTRSGETQSGSQPASARGLELKYVTR